MMTARSSYQRSIIPVILPNFAYQQKAAGDDLAGAMIDYLLVKSRESGLVLKR